MSNINLSAVMIVFAVAVHLLMQFNQDISVSKWLTPFSLTGLLALLMLLLPWMQKGSVVAFMAGYLAIGFLVINLLVLFSLAHLPGQAVKLSSANSVKAGAILLKVLGTGLIMFLSSLVRRLGQGIAQVTMLLLRAWTADGNASQPIPQKLLESGIV